MNRPAWKQGSRIAARLLLTLLLTLVLLLAGAWAVLALWYQLPVSEAGRRLAGALWCIGTVAALVPVW